MRFVLLLASLSLATAAAADEAKPMVSPACRAEIQTLCPKTGDHAARRECMRASRAKLTPGCRDELAKMRAAVRQWRATRGGDVAPAPMDNASDAAPR